MGRVKLEIKRLDNTSNRQSTYSKRKNGILKKAHELSVLCDVDLILIMFSPGGKPSFCCGKHSIDGVIEKFSQLPPQERAKRKLENLEVLKKTFKKLDHDVNIPDYIGTNTPPIKDLTEHADMLRTRVEEADERLRYWRNPEEVNDLEHLMRMEDSLKKSLEQIQRQKEIFANQRQVLLQSHTELPFNVTPAQQLQSLLWGNTDYIQQASVREESNLHTQRDIESCTGSNSGSYFGCLSTSSKSEENSSGQLSGIENIGQDTFQGIQFGGQNPYVPLYNSLNMPIDNSFQGLLRMDQQQSNMGYDVGRNYHPTVPSHDICNHLAPESPADSAFGDYLNYQRQLAASAPGVPSTTFERIARDSTHILFENTLPHYA